MPIFAGIDRLARRGQGFTEKPQRPFPLEKIDAGNQPWKMRPGIDMDATAAAEKAEALAEKANQPDLAAKNRELLKLYRAGQPVRDTP